MKSSQVDVRSTARRVQVVMFGMLVTLLAAFGVSAWAQQPPPAAPPPPGMEGGGPRMGMGPGPGMRGMHDDHEHGHDGMRGMHGGMGEGGMFGGSPERMGRKIDFMLDGLNASDAQRSQIKQIAAQAAADLKTQADAGRGLRERGMEILASPTVDANAAEKLRQQMLQQHDQMSRRVMQAMLAVANVLTPEQRMKLGERMHDRQARMQDRMKRMQDRMHDRMQGHGPAAGPAAPSR